MSRYTDRYTKRKRKRDRTASDSRKICIYVIVIIKLISNENERLTNRVKRAKECCKEWDHVIGARQLLPTDHPIGGWRWREDSCEAETIKEAKTSEKRSFIDDTTEVKEHLETRDAKCFYE